MHFILYQQVWDRVPWFPTMPVVYSKEEHGRFAYSDEACRAQTNIMY